MPSHARNDFNEFVVYMEGHWIGVWSNDKCVSNPRFDIDEWCVYDMFLRTNNFSESANFTNVESVGRHPLYEAWVKALARMFAESAVRFKRYLKHGKCVPKSKRERLKNKLLKMEQKVLEIETNNNDNKQKILCSIITFLKRSSKMMKCGNDTLEKMIAQTEKKLTH